MADSGQRLLIAPATLLEGELGASFLDRASFCVRTAGSGDEALAIARAWAPALVVVGSDLGDMTAATLTSSIREQVNPGIKLLLLTEVIEPDPAGEQLAADAHLVAPVDPANLLRAIAELLEVPARRSPRVAVRILGRLEGLFEETERVTGLANILCLGEGGVLLEAPGPLRFAGEGVLQFVIPGAGIPLAPKVKARALIDEIRLHYGMAFVDLDAESRAHLRAYVAARLGAPKTEDDPTNEFDRD